VAHPLKPPASNTPGVAEYLRRIRFDDAAGPDRHSLRRLHVAHMLAVPFENLDIVPLHRTIHLDEPALLDKIVAGRRGGFCYELNGAFAWLLRQIGFGVDHLNGRVLRADGSLGIPFDHLALRVSVPGEEQAWLADVGFGDSFLEPLPLAVKGEFAQAGYTYRLDEMDGGYALLREQAPGEWKRQYFFDLEPRRFPADYADACLYHQTSPRSSFTRAPIISLALPDGRITLEREKLITTVSGRRSEVPIRSQQAYERALLEHFGVRLSAE
jgi:N-hydroxyarylamine O-acetyltransferase